MLECLLGLLYITLLFLMKCFVVQRYRFRFLMNTMPLTCTLYSSVMPNMLHCQITHSTRFAQHVEIIKPNPTTNPNPKTLTLVITLTVTEEINIK